VSELIPIGVDIGSRRISISAPTIRLLSTIDLGKGAGPGMREAELMTLQLWVRDLVRRAGLDPQNCCIWVEATYLSSGAGGNAAVTVALAEVSTIVRTAVEWADAEQVIPGTWKKEVLGYGIAEKTDIQEWLWVSDPELAAGCECEDEFDASCIGYYGMMRLTMGLQRPVKTPRRSNGRRRAAT
jgi:Holliday junction resolvasome RuvABC endonuclease subunit